VRSGRMADDEEERFVEELLKTAESAHAQEATAGAVSDVDEETSIAGTGPANTESKEG